MALFTNDVRAVPAALRLARAAGATIRQNITFAVLTKVGPGRTVVPAACHARGLCGQGSRTGPTHPPCGCRVACTVRQNMLLSCDRKVVGACFKLPLLWMDCLWLIEIVCD